MLSSFGRTNFNCTIQELKRQRRGAVLEFAQYFNCTIQELKRDEYEKDNELLTISIAPYRN